MHEYVRHQRKKVHPHTDALQLQMPYNYKIEAFCGRDFSRGTTSTTTSCCDIDLVQLAAMHRLPTYYNNYDAVRDRRGRTTRADAADAPAALHRLMDTDEAMTMPTPTSTPPPPSCMENMKRRLKTTTTTAA